jgi:diadenosine tetraphosphate (Ap4A) HIT family hydrolase
VPENSTPLPDFTRWPSFPFEGNMRVKALADPVEVEPPRSGEDASDCVACNTPDDAYIWVSERWRVRAMDRPTGLPMVLILECRSHLDLGDLPNLLAAELGVMTVRLERAIRSLDGVARVHVNRWGDGSAHLHMWFLARPLGRLQLRGTFLSLWDDILPVIPEQQWRENLALVAAWLAEFGGQANAEPAHIEWQSPSTISESPSVFANTDDAEEPETSASGAGAWRPANLGDVQGAGSTPAAAYAETAPIEAVAPLNADVASTESAIPQSTINAEVTDAEVTNADEPPLAHADANDSDSSTEDASAERSVVHP